MKKSKNRIKVLTCGLLITSGLILQQRAGTTLYGYLPAGIKTFISSSTGFSQSKWKPAVYTFDMNSKAAVSPYRLAQAAAPRSADSVSSLTKYIQKRFGAPEVREAFRYSDAAELEKTAGGIELKKGYLGASLPASALKPEEKKALEALAARC